MNKQTIITTTIVVLGLGFILFAFLKKTSDKPIRLLPLYGESKIINGDTVYHKVPDFSFTDQDGKTITQETFKGKIYITDFFFTTCQSICPIMTSNIAKVYEQYKNDSDIYFLSHTVNPENDSVVVLKDYALKYGASSDKWHFVTGDKKSLYYQARKGYYLDATEGDGGPDDFVHTPDFALIDPNRQIRGYYDGTKESDMEKLKTDLNLLKQEFGLTK